MTASDVSGLKSADCVQGNAMALSADGSTLHINDAQVVISDIEASNVVSHVIDSVLISATL